MKKKLVELTPPINTKKDNWWTTVQYVDSILILNIYHEKKLKCRHCIDVKSHEFMTLKDGEWSATRINTALELEADYQYYYSESEARKRLSMSKQDEALILELLSADKQPVFRRDAYNLIDYIELEKGQERRERAEYNRMVRVNEMMGRLPRIPMGIKAWIDQKALGGEEYATKSVKKGIYVCSKCEAKCSESKFKRVDGEKKIRHKDMVICPACGAHLRIIKRSEAVNVDTNLALVQPIDDEVSVVRHFDVTILCGGGKKKIILDEAVRIVLFKDVLCDIYYNQYYRGHNSATEGDFNHGFFDNKSNYYKRGAFAGYLYDGGIEEAFKGTAYKAWTRLFTQMAAAGVKANYNRLMIAKDSDAFIGVIELLFKGRFYKLLKETSENVSVWAGKYCGPLGLYGTCIEDTFDISDRQKINRIRDKDGGELMWEWMHWSDRKNIRISDKALDWLIKNRLEPDDMEGMLKRMSLEQSANYIERQRKESYKGSSIKKIISQYEDYLNMCKKLKKHLDDEMVYRPRDLKRRHDEAVEQIALLEAELKAEEYNERFPGAEDILHEIKAKYEYENEQYIMRVPGRLIEIVEEGRALHHCAGSCDRYFDRIKQRETYICFLRKKKEPDKPYYTIEVEPSGTIRQHRGYLDEEPEIEVVKPFLREWQKVIKKRLTQQDLEYAQRSAVKRQENIDELKAKKNTRVLEGLMEDFMEAI